MPFGIRVTFDYHWARVYFPGGRCCASAGRFVGFRCGGLSWKGAPEQACMRIACLCVTSMMLGMTSTNLLTQTILHPPYAARLHLWSWQSEMNIMPTVVFPRSSFNLFCDDDPEYGTKDLKLRKPMESKQQETSVITAVLAAKQKAAPV